jgi:hypothetical protein
MGGKGASESPSHATSALMHIAFERDTATFAVIGPHFDLHPSEWPNFYFGIGHERGGRLPP